MDRRDFLAMLVAALFGLSLDPERLLWVPGKKLISIPSRPVEIYSLADMISAQIEAVRPDRIHA